MEHAHAAGRAIQLARSGEELRLSACARVHYNVSFCYRSRRSIVCEVIGTSKRRRAGGLPDVWDALREKKIGVRILLGVFIGAIAVSMLLYLVPQQSGNELTNADVIAQVGNQTVTTADVQTQLNRISRNGQIPPSILPLYAKQMLDQ